MDNYLQNTNLPYTNYRFWYKTLIYAIQIIVLSVNLTIQMLDSMSKPHKTSHIKNGTVFLLLGIWDYVLLGVISYTRVLVILDIPRKIGYTWYMLTDMEIPDPFTSFRMSKYAKSKGYGYDFFTSEWSYRCTTCKEDLSAPSRKIMTKIRLYHTRNECLGGYWLLYN